MFFNFTPETRFFCYQLPVDMRKGIHSLYNLTKSECSCNPLSGDAFVFIASSRKSVKVLRWHNEGFILYHKRLELGVYSLPSCKAECAFAELSGDSFEALVGKIKHRSYSNEFKREILLNL